MAAQCVSCYRSWESTEPSLVRSQYADVVCVWEEKGKNSKDVPIVLRCTARGNARQRLGRVAIRTSVAVRFSAKQDWNHVDFTMLNFIFCGRVTEAARVVSSCVWIWKIFHASNIVGLILKGLLIFISRILRSQKCTSDVWTGKLIIQNSPELCTGAFLKKFVVIDIFITNRTLDKGGAHKQSDL